MNENEATRVSRLRFKTFWGTYYFDVYLTGNDMIFIRSLDKTAIAATTVGGALGGMIGAGIGSAISSAANRSKSNDVTNSRINLEDLDEKLARTKGSFAIAHDDVQEIRMRESTYASSEIYVDILNSGTKRFWTEKNQLEQLYNALITIPILQGKIKLFK